MICCTLWAGSKAWIVFDSYSQCQSSWSYCSVHKSGIPHLSILQPVMILHDTVRQVAIGSLRPRRSRCKPDWPSEQQHWTLRSDKPETFRFSRTTKAFPARCTCTDTPEFSDVTYLKILKYLEGSWRCFPGSKVPRRVCRQLPVLWPGRSASVWRLALRYVEMSASASVLKSCAEICWDVGGRRNVM